MNGADERLGALYPHLQEQPAGSAEGLLESVRAKAQASCALKERYFSQHADELLAAARALADIYAAGRRVFTMGNGGSGCDAAHFAVEFTHPVTVGRPSLPTVNLADDTAFLTAVGNDVSFADVFQRRLIALAGPGDGLVAFSTSGHSENLTRALEHARGMGITTFALLGGDGGRIRARGLAEHALWVENESIHRVQEVHVAIYHVLWDVVHTLLADRRGAAAP